MPNGAINLFPDSLAAAMSGFSRREELHFVYVRGRMIFFGYYEQCTRYIEQFVKTSCLISSRDLGDECPIVAYHSEHTN